MATVTSAPEQVARLVCQGYWRTGVQHPCNGDVECSCGGAKVRFPWLMTECSNLNLTKDGTIHKYFGCTVCSGTGYVLLRDADGRVPLRGLMEAAKSLGILTMRSTMSGYVVYIDGKHRGDGVTLEEAVSLAILAMEGGDGVD